jgi:hypothetical protein
MHERTCEHEVVVVIATAALSGLLPAAVTPSSALTEKRPLPADIEHI